MLRPVKPFWKRSKKSDGLKMLSENSAGVFRGPSSTPKILGLSANGAMLMMTATATGSRVHRTETKSQRRPAGTARSTDCQPMMRLKRFESTAEFACGTRIRVVARRAGYRYAHVQSEKPPLDTAMSWHDGERIPGIELLSEEVAHELICCLDATNRRMVQSGAFGSIAVEVLQCVCGSCIGCLTMKSALRIATEPYANDGFIRGMRDISEMPLKACFDAILDPEQLARLMALAATTRDVPAAFVGHVDDLEWIVPTNGWSVGYSDLDVCLFLDGAMVAAMGMAHARQRHAQIMGVTGRCAVEAILRGEQ